MNLDRSPVRRPRLLLFNITFVLLGIDTTILGPVLPALSSRWNLNDAHAGTLFTAQFIGSSLGGLLASIHPFRSAITGLITVASSLILLTIASPTAAVPVLFIFGLGVGLALTGINLTVSGISGEHRGAALTWLNFCWSLGATVCPLLAGAFVPRGRLDEFLMVLFAASVLMIIAVARYAPSFARSMPPQSPTTASATSSIRFFVAYFAAILFLYVGIETATGGWLSTLATRSHRTDIAGAIDISASSFFWLALLVGRGLFALALGRIRETVLQPLAVGAALISVCLLLMAQSYIQIVIAASLVGLSLAPIFPLSLSFFLSHAERSKSEVLVFGGCGLGAPFCLG